jgi:Flp pilus assembly protein TadB
MGLHTKKVVLVILFCILTCTVHTELRYAKGYIAPNIEQVYTNKQANKATLKQKKRSKTVFKSLSKRMKRRSEGLQKALRKTSKTQLSAFFLCLFLGYLGIHRFYLRNYIVGVLMLLTLGGFGLMVIYDLVSVSYNQLMVETADGPVQPIPW